MSKKLHYPTLFTSIVLLISGTLLLYYSEKWLQTIPTLQMFILVLGFVLFTYTLFLLFARTKRWVYTPTGSLIKRESIYMKEEDATRLANALKKGDPFSLATLPIQRSSNCYLDMLLSSDEEFIAVQMMRLEGFKYEPDSPVYTYRGEEARAIVKKFKR